MSRQNLLKDVKGQVIQGFVPDSAKSVAPVVVSAPVQQVSTVTITDFDIGDTIEITGIGGTSAPVVCTTSITATVDLLVTEITNRTGETVTATNVGGVLTLTALVAGIAFTAVATVVDLGTALVTIATVATPTPNAGALVLSTLFDIENCVAIRVQTTAALTRYFGTEGLKTFPIFADTPTIIYLDETITEVTLIGAATIYLEAM